MEQRLADLEAKHAWLMEKYVNLEKHHQRMDQSAYASGMKISALEFQLSKLNDRVRDLEKQPSAGEALRHSQGVESLVKSLYGINNQAITSLAKSIDNLRSASVFSAESLSASVHPTGDKEEKRSSEETIAAAQRLGEQSREYLGAHAVKATQDLMEREAAIVANQAMMDEAEFNRRNNKPPLGGSSSSARVVIPKSAFGPPTATSMFSLQDVREVIQVHDARITALEQQQQPLRQMEENVKKTKQEMDSKEAVLKAAKKNALDEIGERGRLYPPGSAQFELLAKYRNDIHKATNWDTVQAVVEACMDAIPRFPNQQQQQQVASMDDEW
jgi:hypothetical protein